MVNRVDEIRKMLKTDPNDSFLTYALGLEYEKAGDLKKAIEVIKDLINTDPDYLGAYYKLGQLFEATNKMDSARKIYAHGIKLSTEKNDNKAKGELEEALWLIEEEQ